jgi:hypothetical protein
MEIIEVSHKEPDVFNANATASRDKYAKLMEDAKPAQNIPNQPLMEEAAKDQHAQDNQ